MPEATPGAPTTPAPAAPATTGTPAVPETKPAEAAPVEQDLLTGETGKAETTPAPDKAPADKGVEISIKVPDGIEVDKAVMDEFVGHAKDLGLKSEGAQKLFDLYVKSQTDFSQRADAAWNEQKTQWRDAVKSDKEIGGAGMDAAVRVARTAIDKFGGAALKKALNDLGIGNHPEIVRFAYRVGKAISEDSIAGVGPGSAPQVNDEEATLRAAFPSMYK